VGRCQSRSHCPSSSSPDEAEQVIDNDPLDIEAEIVDGEQRFSSVGRTDQGRFLLVVTTFRNSRIRVVTAFPAPRSLIHLYFLHTET